MQRLSDRKILPFPVVKGGNEKEQEIAKEITKEVDSFSFSFSLFLSNALSLFLKNPFFSHLNSQTIDLMKVILVIVIQPTLTLLRRDSNVDLSRGF